MKGTIPTDEERKLLLKKIEKLRSEEGLSIHLACGKVGISEPSFYAWRKKFQTLKTRNQKEIGPTTRSEHHRPRYQKRMANGYWKSKRCIPIWGPSSCAFT